VDQVYDYAEYYRIQNFVDSLAELCRLLSTARGINAITYIALLGRRVPEERGRLGCMGKFLDEVVAEVKELSGCKI
jgi:hypothetical protein